MEFYPGDIVDNGFKEYEVKAYYKDADAAESVGRRTFYAYPAVEYTDGGWDPEHAVSLVRRTWQDVTGEEYALLKRLGIPFEEQTVKIIRVRYTGGK